MITNLKFDQNENKIYIKRSGQKNLEIEEFKKSFYTKRGMFTSNKIFSVEQTGKLDFFTRMSVDRVVINDVRHNNLFETVIRNNPNLIYLYDLYPEYQYLLMHRERNLSDQYNIAYLDIETDDDLNADDASSPILMISLKYKDSIEWKMSSFELGQFKSERLFLHEFFDFLTELVFPDVILGWNVIGYDLKYLVNRAKRIGVQYNKRKFKMIEFINGMDIIIKRYGYSVIKDTEGMSLQNVAKYYLKRGKTEVLTTFGKLYRKDKELAIKYNQNDIELVYDLDQELQLINFLIKIQEVSGVLLRDTFFNSIVIDNMILKRYENYVFPSKRLSQTDLVDIEYEGGYVFMPPKGVFENVILIDFSSLYPSLILTFNLSPDTKSNEGTSRYIDGIGFKSQPDGILKETIKFLYGERLRLKRQLSEFNNEESMEYKRLDTLQSAYKTILNSFYGVMAFPKFRLYDIDVAKSITSMGRKFLKVVKAELEKRQVGQVLYGDTDSEIVQTDRNPEDVLNIVNKEIIPEYLKVYNVVDNYLFMELANEFDKIALFGKKKVYIARLKTKREFVIKGFSVSRYDTPKRIRHIIKEIIYKLFDNETIDLQQYFDIIKKFTKNDLIVIKKMNKAKDAYKVEPQHLKALRYSMTNFSLTGDDVTSNLIKMIYIIPSDKYNTNIIAVGENFNLPDDIKINYERYFLTFLCKQMLDLYDVFGFDKIIGLDSILDKYECSLRLTEKLKDAKTDFIRNKILIDNAIKECEKIK